MKEQTGYRASASSFLTGFLCASCFLYFQGCDADPRVAQLQKQVQDVSKNVEALKEEVEKQKRDLDWNKFIQDSEAVAYLTPGDGGYSVIKTDFGNLTATIDDIKPYANGSRVTFRFGNPMSATLTGVSATVDWGTVDEKGSPRNETEKTREITFDKSLQAGHWTIVAAVLDSVPPTALGFVRVHDLKNKGILLYR